MRLIFCPPSTVASFSRRWRWSWAPDSVALYSGGSNAGRLLNAVSAFPFRRIALPGARQGICTGAEFRAETSNHSAARMIEEGSKMAQPMLDPFRKPKPTPAGTI
jgi:hypothetical protein